LRVISEQRGVIWPKEVMAAIAADPTLGPVIDLPDVPDDWEMRRWNMQSTMDLSHEQVQALHDARIAAAVQAEQEKRVAAADKAEVARRDKLRFDECCVSRVTNDQTYKTTYICKCGGKWSNDISGFKSHETSGKHEKHFPPASWDGFYAVNPAPNPEIHIQLEAQDLPVDDDAMAGVPDRVFEDDPEGFAAYLDATYGPPDIDQPLSNDGAADVVSAAGGGSIAAARPRAPLTIPEGFCSSNAINEELARMSRNY
jgi:hypothetical protein